MVAVELFLCRREYRDMMLFKCENTIVSLVPITHAFTGPAHSGTMSDVIHTREYNPY